MATTNRSVLATLIPKEPIMSLEACKIRISRNSNTDSFVGMLKKFFCQPDGSNIVLYECGCQVAPEDFIDGCLDSCKTGDHAIPFDAARYEDAQGKATVILEVSVFQGAHPTSVPTRT